MDTASFVNSTEVMPAELDYYNTVQLQTAVAHTYYERVKPDGGEATFAENGLITFAITSSNDYTQLRGTELMVKCKVTRRGGGACTHRAKDSSDPSTFKQDKVCVTNNMLHSMFSTVTLNLNGKVVENLEKYPYIAYLSDLTTPDHKLRDRQATMRGWTRDTFGQLDAKAYGGANTGMNERSRQFANSQEVTLYGKLHIPLMEQGRCLLPNTTGTLELKMSKNAFMLIADDDEKYEMKIVKAELWLQRVQAKKEVDKAIEDVMSKLPENKLKLPVIARNLVVRSIASGSQEASIQFFTNSTLPDWVLIGMVSNGSLNETYGANPFNFKHFGLKTIKAVANGVVIPRVEYAPTWTAPSGYIREYRALLDAFGALDNSEDKLDISLEEFGNGFTLFAFRITPRDYSGELGLQENGTLQLDFGFTSTLSENVNVLCFFERRETRVVEGAVQPRKL